MEILEGALRPRVELVSRSDTEAGVCARSDGRRMRQLARSVHHPLGGRDRRVLSTAERRCEPVAVGNLG